MIPTHEACQNFKINGPNINGKYVFKRLGRKFIRADENSLEKVFSTEFGVEVDIYSLNTQLDKILKSLNEGNFADAAIRFAQLRYRDFKKKRKSDIFNSEKSVLKAGFDPGEQRDEKGRWTSAPASQPDRTNINLRDQKTVVIDPMCRIHKIRCIAECTEQTLPTKNYGGSFYKCHSNCMDAVGCLGRA